MCKAQSGVFQDDTTQIKKYTIIHTWQVTDSAKGLFKFKKVRCASKEIKTNLALGCLRQIQLKIHKGVSANRVLPIIMIALASESMLFLRLSLFHRFFNPSEHQIFNRFCKTRRMLAIGRKVGVTKECFLCGSIWSNVFRQVLRISHVCHGSKNRGVNFINSKMPITQRLIHTHPNLCLLSSSLWRSTLATVSVHSTVEMD